MALPNNFNVTPNNVIASYDWQDFISKTGYTRFYLTMAVSSDGSYPSPSLTTQYLLQTQAIDSEVYYLSYEDNAGSNSLRATLTFDSSPFKDRVSILGDVFFTLSHYTYATAGNDCDVYCNIELFNYDGSTATSLGSVYTSMSSEKTAGVKEAERVVARIASVDSTMSPGDVLRIVVKIYVQDNNGGSAAGVFFDPTGLSVSSGFISTSLPLDFSAYIPFRIAL